MKKNIFLWCLLIVFVNININCKKKKEGCTDPISLSYDPDAEKDNGSCEYGGTGGVKTIVAFPKFNGSAVKNKVNHPDSAFVKFNAITSPGVGSSFYDTVYVGETGEDHVHLKNLKRGKYFVFVTGFDSISNQRVTGGLPVEIGSGSNEFDVEVPVSN